MKRVLLLAVMLVFASAAVSGQTAISADGVVESSSGGFMFPDGTIQATAAAPGTVITEVPYTINDAGYYCLVSNLTMSVSGSAITIAADDVTLDFAGFSLDGAFMGTRGVEILAGVASVEIRNGSIRGFSIDSIQAVNATGVRVQGIRVFGSDWGINLGGGDHVVEGCLVAQSGGQRAIYVQGNSRVINNTVSRTGGTGIFAQSSSSVVGNRIHMNAGDGISVWGGILIRSNVIGGTPSNGIYIDGGANVIEENTITGGNHGITFNQDGNFYANNRAMTALDAYNLGSTLQRDGGGNWDGAVP